MLDPSVIKFFDEHTKQFGIWGLVAFVGLYCIQIYMTARRATPAAALRDASHDEIMGTLRNVQTSVEALGRKQDAQAARHEQMHADGERDRESIKRDLAMMVGIIQGGRRHD
ncbi:hypothetical protein [Paracoccus beibuensis]|uniref:hypothetical protein n=1 Tax=Paracoccus beibuensis TaxID=547602 RepID=UPI002240D319|nr:hypothetical protein [Paracoccus beibuensis]